MVETETNLMVDTKGPVTLDLPNLNATDHDDNHFNTPAERIISLFKEIQRELCDDSEKGAHYKKRIGVAIISMHDRKNLFKVDRRVSASS